MEKASKKIKIEDYTYHLPVERIAKYPKIIRDESRLLYYDQEKISSLQFKQLPELLQQDDLLIFNDAKVIQARLAFAKETGAQIEIFCLEPYHPSDYNLAFQVSDECEWKCLVGNLKKWKSGKLVKNILLNKLKITLEAHHSGKISNSEIIRFKWYPTDNQLHHKKISFGDILEQTGTTPLPPYLDREAETEDKTRYQTIYARIRGSVAAPTAGLHFTENVFKSLSAKGIKTETITLHVGAGTFRPVKSETIDGHEMHTEHFEVNRNTLEHLFSHHGRIISVGTTSVRTLESIHRIGAKLINQCHDPMHILQWEVYENPIEANFKDSIRAILNYMQKEKIEVLQASTSIMIVPGYRFKTIQGLITNFHQPQSTLLLLIAAVVGEKWHQIYHFALANDYRFLSYGDSSLLLI